MLKLLIQLFLLRLVFATYFNDNNQSVSNPKNINEANSRIEFLEMEINLQNEKLFELKKGGFSDEIGEIEKSIASKEDNKKKIERYLNFSKDINRLEREYEKINKIINKDEKTLEKMYDAIYDIKSRRDYYKIKLKFLDDIRRQILSFS